MFAIMKRLLSVMLFASVFALATPAQADEKQSRAPGPLYSLPADAETCVRDTSFMRRNHMKLLLHKRDDTMRNGVRTKKESLQGCINCHVTKNEAGKAIKVSDPKHFCAACHQYTAVKLDCFECHRSTPDTPKNTASIPKIPAHASLLASLPANEGHEAKALGNFLKGVTQ